MVEHQSCAGLVNASALCAIDGMSSVAEISAELLMEKQRNAELVERISVLEAQIHERNKAADGQGCCVNTSEAENRVKKFKRQKVEASIDGSEDGNNIKREMQSQVIRDSQCKDKSAEGGLVNWMSMDKTHFEKLKDIVQCDADISIDRKERGINENLRAAGNEEIVDDGMQIQSVSSSGKLLYERGDNPNSDRVLTAVRELKKHESNKIDGSKAATEGAKGVSNASISHNRKPPKVAFCPKEVKKVMESEQLLLKNAQSHTIRKIIVFASLGIRHGCEDMYELDLNHFSIVGKGEPYVSSNNPGEHVLYENPGGRRKTFYPNRQNPTLCPVRVLEEEKVMRPSDGSCPSCLFLCIKYGGRTRNLPQNEYVRQRMGRNKLKSFGPVTCRMAMLANIRSGSFFFKALGITLLFMAGFPDDLVQRETKYRSLDLLQKYYRRDEDTEGEELFLPHLVNHDTTDTGPQQLRVKAKPKGKKQTHKPHGLPKPLTQPLSSTPPSQFGLMNYNHSMAAFQSMPCHTPAPVPNSNQNPYHMQPTNALMPMMFWPPPKAFPPCPYPSLYGFQSLPSAKNYITFHQQPYYTHSIAPQMVEGTGKNDVAPEESQGDSNSTSSS